MDNIDWSMLNRVQKVTITPEIATRIITKNICNRNISIITVKKYTAEMIEETWQKNAPNILSFSSDGYLLDGQHRLNAVIQSKKTYDWFVYIHNKDSENITPMDLMVDIGKKRTISDMTNIHPRIVAPIFSLLKLCVNRKYEILNISHVFDFYKIFVENDEILINLLRRKKTNLWSDAYFKSIAIAYYISNQENKEYVTDLVNSILQEDLEDHPILLKYIFRVSRQKIDRATYSRLAVNLFDKKNKNAKLLKIYEKPLAPLLRNLLTEAGLQEGFWK